MAALICCLLELAGSTSRGPSPIDAHGIIRPLRVTESGGAADKGVGAQGRPRGLAQVGRGFDDYDFVSGPGDGETKRM